MPSVRPDKDFETEMDVDALKRVAEIQKDSARKRRALAKIKEGHNKLDVAENALRLRRGSGGKRS